MSCHRFSVSTALLLPTFALLTILGGGGAEATGGSASGGRGAPASGFATTAVKAGGKRTATGKTGSVTRRGPRGRFTPPIVSRTPAKAQIKSQAKARGKAKAPVRAAAAVPPPRGRVVVFAFKGDEETSELIRARVVRALRAKGLKVTTTLRPVDSAEQYREMAVALDLAAYVDGNVSEDGDQASATVHVRSGVTGLRVASATFAGERRKLPAEVGKTLWDEVGPAFSRVCAEAAKPRKLERAPMRIEAGTPIESTPRDTQEGT